MIVERCLLASLLREPDQRDRVRNYYKLVERDLVISGWNDSDVADAFSFITRYVDDYKVVPSENIVIASTGIELPEYLNDAPFDFWLDEVRRLRLAAVFQHGLRDMQERLKKGAVEDVTDMYMSIMDKVSLLSGKRDVVFLSDALDEVVAHHSALQHGHVSTKGVFGVPYIDRVSGGPQPGDIWAVVGSTGVGKTFVMCNSALKSAEAGSRVLFVTMEMPYLQIARRSGSLGAGVSATHLRLGRMSEFAMDPLLAFINEWKEKERDRFILMEGRTSMSTLDILGKIREYNPDICYIDGAYMLSPKSGAPKARWEQVMLSVEELKRVAHDTEIPLICSYQFSKDGEKRGVKGIGYSYAIAQIASVALALTHVGDDDDNHDEVSGTATRVLSFIKGREGERGSVLLRYDMRLSSITQDSIIEAVPGFEEDEDGDEY